MDKFREGPVPFPASGLSPQPLGQKAELLGSLSPQNLSRGLVNVAAKLTHNKDVRDLFVDLVEKVSCPACVRIPNLACICAIPVLDVPLAHSSWSPAAPTTGH